MTESDDDGLTTGIVTLQDIRKDVDILIHWNCQNLFGKTEEIV